ncbi:50S ribosomal protein L23 [Mesomycoplasma neurolyticum]|uniref:Large ribosomal subunit protein uL23 n=1 Tax=Mesomycoplasma neurolyticum TaxID=2120 RepID=A0A449A661_9BACT|nr:50S ribosomal protein L23 [Mesomycoplasma neurolyticum]VEU59728.1 50S ribosomal protein L23 [Mesomycoplasma neurolyticum]
MKANEIIKYPILTEKSYQLMSSGVYVFAVDRKTNRSEVKKAIQSIFDVEVIKVNIFNVPKKPAKLGRFKGFKNSYKKAIVTLAEGHTINLLNEDLEESQDSKEVVENTQVSNEEKKSTRETKDASAIEKKVAEKLASKSNKE